MPISVSFKKYHVEHHRYLGEDGLDTDVPTELEALFFTSPLRKFLWLSLQPFFYAFRPLIIYKKAPTDLEILNAVIQVILQFSLFTSSIQVLFDVGIVYFFSFKSLAYLWFGTSIAMGLHPSAGHFISEHYIFDETQETYRSVETRGHRVRHEDDRRAKS